MCVSINLWASRDFHYLTLNACRRHLAQVPGVVTRSGKVVVSIRTRKFGSSWSRTGAGPGSKAVGTRGGSYSCSRAQMCWRRSATERDDAAVGRWEACATSGGTLG